jgi:hypothetical protein
MKTLSCFDPIHIIPRYFKKAGIYGSVRAGRNYRALAKNRDEGVVWFWIGRHADYDGILNG